MLAITILALGIVSRLIIHPDNFTPVIALALFGGFYLKKKQAIILPLVFLAITDVILGFHNTMLFTWGSVVLIAAIGLWGKEHKSVLTVGATSLGSAVLFFFITNFGVWLVSGMYPFTFEGLSKCFIMAIPYFRGTLLSTFVYTVVLFGLYELVVIKIKKTRFAHVLS